MGTTENYTYTIEDVPVGTHIVGIQASYKAALSEMVTMEVVIEKSNLSHVVFNVTANSILSPDGQTLRVLSLADGSQHDLVVSEGKAEIVSLPNGQYLVSMEEGAFEAYQQTVDVTEDASFDIVLEDNKIEPYNITATADEDGRYTMRWNQDLAFVESFEDYDDFASGQFGEWKTMDVDQLPVYPISLNGQIISFPGSGSPTNPMAIPPMVFNPWSTQPAMLPTDQAVAAPTGDKTVIFFSPQMGMADKWLISPPIEINEGYQFSISAKAYASAYPESMEFCVSLDASTSQCWPARPFVWPCTTRLPTPSWHRSTTSRWVRPTARASRWTTATWCASTSISTVRRWARASSPRICCRSSLKASTPLA